MRAAPSHTCFYRYGERTGSAVLPPPPGHRPESRPQSNRKRQNRREGKSSRGASPTSAVARPGKRLGSGREGGKSAHLGKPRNSILPEKFSPRRPGQTSFPKGEQPERKEGKRGLKKGEDNCGHVNEGSLTESHAASREERRMHHRIMVPAAKTWFIRRSAAAADSPGGGTPRKAGLIARRPNAHWAEIKTSAPGERRRCDRQSPTVGPVDGQTPSRPRRGRSRASPAPSSAVPPRAATTARDARGSADGSIDGWALRPKSPSRTTRARSERGTAGRGVQAGCGVARNLLDEGPLALAATLSNPRPTEHFRSSCFQPQRSVATFSGCKRDAEFKKEYLSSGL